MVSNAALYSFGTTIEAEDIAFENSENNNVESKSKKKNPAGDSFHEKSTLNTFELNKSKEWLRCVINAIKSFGDNKANISSRELIKVFKSPSGGKYTLDASFSPAINQHIKNFLILLETDEFIEQKDIVVKLNVIRRALQKKESSSKK